MKRCMPLWIALVVTLAATPSEAVTVDDVIGLTRADAGDDVILAKIQADGTVFRLTVDEILALKQSGVSDTVITYMINTGKNEAQPAEPVADTPTVTELESQPQETVTQGADDSYYYGEPSGYGGYGSNTSVNVALGLGPASVGYYYPHWGGYNWSFYFDPFYWNSWPYYYSYWRPFPYYRWYYDPWYYCGTYTYAYYNSCYNGYYQHHGSYRDDYYSGGHRRYKDGGRDVGSRGPTDDGNRRYKGRTPAPDTRSGDVARLDRDGRQVSRPAPPTVRTAPTPDRPSVPRVSRPTPTPGRTPTVRPTPSPTRGAPRPSRTYRGQPATPPTRGTVSQTPRPSRPTVAPQPNRGSRPTVSKPPTARAPRSTINRAPPRVSKPSPPASRGGSSRSPAKSSRSRSGKS